MSNLAITLKSQAFKLAEGGQSKKALSLIESYKPQSVVESRILGHSQAEILMFTGKINEALGLLLQIQKDFGSHVAILTDIAMCFYLLSDFKNWKFAFEDLKAAYEINKDFLCSERRSMVELNIAKFLEEDGEVAAASKLYNQLMIQMDERKDVPRFFRVMAQAMRVMSTFRLSGMLANTYRRMISVGSADINLHADVDVQHALLLSELTLAGAKNATNRLIEILNNEHISEVDKQLIFYDFLEELLLQNHRIDKRLFKFMKFAQLNLYEKEIHRIALSGENKTDFRNLIALSRTLPVTCYIRALGLNLAVSKDTSDTNELRNLLKVILDSLTPESQQLWLSRYHSILIINEDISINFNQASKILFFGTKSIDIARRSGFLEIMEALSISKQVTTESLIQKIWLVDFDSIYYRSLRMTIHRLNEVLFELVGTPKMIEINKHTVTLKGRASIKI